MIPFCAFDPAIRKTIYTTNAIESLNRVIRKSIKTRGSFPTADAATKLIYLAPATSGKEVGMSGKSLPPATHSLSSSTTASTRDRNPHGPDQLHRGHDTPSDNASFRLCWAIPNSRQQRDMHASPRAGSRRWTARWTT